MKTIRKSIMESVQFAFDNGHVSSLEMDLAFAYLSDNPRIRVCYATFMKDGKDIDIPDICWYSTPEEISEDELYAVAWSQLKSLHPDADADSAEAGSVVMEVSVKFNIEQKNPNPSLGVKSAMSSVISEHEKKGRIWRYLLTGILDALGPVGFLLFLLLVWSTVKWWW